MLAHSMIFFVLIAFKLVPTQSQGDSCCHGAARLVDGNGPIPSEGRVEICHYGGWKTVCNHQTRGWGNCEAAVVCGQLGYAHQGTPTTSFGPGSGSILEIMECQGTETVLSNCNLRDFDDRYRECRHHQDVGVRCVPISNNCFEGDIRLTNSKHMNKGRIEICTNGVWGTVCRNNWSSLDSSVVCKQLGFSEYETTTTTVNSGQLPSYFGDVACTGNELRLTDCPHREKTFFCTDCSSVGVHCNYDTAHINVAIDEENMANISWLVPHFVKGNSTQLKYTLTCSTAEAGEPEVLIFETTNTTEQVQLQPYTTYQCCVSIMNEIEIWTPSCKLVASHEEAPNAPPTNISWFALSNTSVLVSWMAPPTKNQHGIIREYHVEIHTESSQLNVTVETYTTENQFIIVENLTPNTSYTCAVAAYTIRMGPYSELISFSLHSETYTCINQALTADLESADSVMSTDHYYKPDLTNKSEVIMYTLAAASGSLLLVLIVITTILGMTYFRICRSPKPEPRSEMVDNVIYETVDESKAETIMNTSISAGRGGSFTKKQNLIMNLINSEKSDMWNISESRRQNNARQSAVNEPYVNGLSSNDIDDGNYQPMIPPRRLNKDKEYQSLSPVEEEAGCPQESENTACAVNVTQNRETKSTYQSLIQDGQTGSGSGDYQLLTKSTLRRHTLQFPVS